MQAERRERLLPPRNDNRRPSIHSKTAALFESSTPAAARLPGPSPSTKGHVRTRRDRGGRPRAGSALRRHTSPPPRASDGRRAGADPMALFLTKRPIREKKATTGIQAFLRRVVFLAIQSVHVVLDVLYRV